MKYKSEIWNIRLAEVLGYTHKEEGVSYSMDHFSPERNYTILSKVPIQTTTFPRDDEKIKVFSIVQPENPEEWAEETIEEGGVPWNILHAGEFIFLKFWNPNKDWNQLMKVANKVGVFRVFSDIDKAYQEICEKISKNN